MTSRARKIWWCCLHAMPCAIWRERTEDWLRIVLEICHLYRINFCFLVASWTSSNVVLSSIPFISILSNLGSVLLLQEIHPTLFVCSHKILLLSINKKKKKKTHYRLKLKLLLSFYGLS